MCGRFPLPQSKKGTSKNTHTGTLVRECPQRTSGAPMRFKKQLETHLKFVPGVMIKTARKNRTAGTAPFRDWFIAGPISMGCVRPGAGFALARVPNGEQMNFMETAYALVHVAFVRTPTLCPEFPRHGTAQTLFGTIASSMDNKQAAVNSKYSQELSPFLAAGNWEQAGRAQGGYKGSNGANR